MSTDLAQFGLGDMLRCSLEVRQLGRNAATMEDAARRICAYLCDELVDADERRACALVRCYVTQPFSGLPDDLQNFARRALRSVEPRTDVDPAMRCLALLATVGDEPAWNDRRESKGHRVIPLPSPELVERAPMIAQLIRAFGLSLADVVRPAEGVVRNLHGKSYGVFHVERAQGSPYIPAQTEFVQPYHVKSVVGFGGSLANDELFAVILFTHITVSHEVADRFRTIALDVKGALMPFSSANVFDPPVVS